MPKNKRSNQEKEIQASPKLVRERYHNKYLKIINYVINHPQKTAYIALIMMIATAIPIWFWNKIFKPDDRTKVDSNPTLNKMLSLCPRLTKKIGTNYFLEQAKTNCFIGIIYEMHFQENILSRITNFLPQLKKAGFTTINIEAVQDYSLKEQIDYLKESIKHEVNCFYENNIKERIRLLRAINKHQLHYNPIDITYNELKFHKKTSSLTSTASKACTDMTMVERIQNACNMYGGGQLVIVGLMHVEIEHFLRSIYGEDNIVSIYFVNYPPLDQKLGIKMHNPLCKFDYMLRLGLLKKYSIDKIKENFINTGDQGAGLEYTENIIGAKNLSKLALFRKLDVVNTYDYKYVNSNDIIKEAIQTKLLDRVSSHRILMQKP